VHSKALESLDKGPFSEYLDIYDLFSEIYAKLKFVPNTFMLLEFSLLRYVTGNSKKVEIVKAAEEKKIEEKPKIPAIKIEEPKKPIIKEEEEEEIIIEVIKPEVIPEKVQKNEASSEEIVTEKPKSATKPFDIGAFIDGMKLDKGK
jgi:hypothetical protein